MNPVPEAERTARSPAREALIRSVNPRDGSPLPDVLMTPVEEVSACVARARAAQPAWAALPVTERARRLRDAHQRFLANAEELLSRLESENGKPRGESLTGELVASSELFKFWTGPGARWLTPEKVGLNPVNFPGKISWIERVPHGVVGVISSWNYPVALPLRVIVPALLAGNAVVFKPSEWTPRAGAALAKLLQGALPDGVLILVQGDGRQGEAMITGGSPDWNADKERSGVDFVSFTGSVPTGLKVSRECGGRLLPCSLELGGKDAAIVRADADMKRAVAGIVWGALTNAGQNCASIERVYVHASVHDEFVKLILEEIGGLAPGQIGPMTMPTQREIVQRHVDDAVQKGAQLHCGGKIPEGAGSRYPATVLTGAREDMLIFREETFGPVLAVARVADDEEAVRRANDSRYGLNGSVWTRDIPAGRALARRLNVGVALVNSHCFTGAVAGLPWGGVKLSGRGSTNGKESLMELTRPRVHLVDQSSRPELWWYPYNQGLEDVAFALLGLAQKGASLPKNLLRLIRGFLRR